MDEHSLREVFSRLAALSVASIATLGSCNNGSKGQRSQPNHPESDQPATGPTVFVPESEPTQDPEPAAAPPPQPPPPTKQSSIDLDRFAQLPCDQFKLKALLHGLTPASPHEYLEERSVTYAGGGRQHAQPAQVVATAGEKCAGAKNRAACEQRLDGTTTDKGYGADCVQLCSHSYLVGSRGDDVFVVDSVAELKKFLGDIDSTADAVLLASAENYHLACGDVGEGAFRKMPKGFELIATRMTKDCPIERTRYVLAIDTRGRLQVVAQEIIPSQAAACVGRRLPGTAEVPVRSVLAANAVGAFFARVAQLEAESIESFEQLADELQRFGAPAELSAAARSAADDERRHARAMGALARHFDSAVPAARRGAKRAASLLDLAVSNVEEGCVRETFGALLATRQTLTSHDPHVAAAMFPVAQEETRHAALAYRIAAWIDPQLTPKERAIVRERAIRALDQLAEECSADPAPALQQLAGLPDARAARSLLQGLRSEVYEQAPWC